MPGFKQQSTRFVLFIIIQHGIQRGIQAFKATPGTG